MIAKRFIISGKLTAVLWIVTALCLRMYGQEQSAIKMSNFGGINAVSINPTTTINSRLFLDVNLFGAYVNVENNFLFIHKNDYRLLNFLSPDPVLPTYDIPGEGLDYTVTDKPVQAYQLAGIAGPSFGLSLGRHSIGLITRAGAATSIDDLPRDIAILMFEGLEYDSLYGIDQQHRDFDVASMGWYEIGANYAYVLKNEIWYNLSAGINVRYLRGYAGAQITGRAVDYTLEDENHLNIRNLDAGIAAAIPIDYDSNEFPGPGRTFKGNGAAFDLGVTFRQYRSPDVRSEPRHYCQYDYHDYLFRVGFSLLDLGGINFRENIQVHGYDNVSADWMEVDSLDFRNLNDLTDVLSEVFYGDPDASRENVDRFRIGLPAAMSLQADVNYYPNWYIGGMVVLPLSMAGAQLKRPGQAVMSLRYETPALEVSLPVSLYDFRKARIGLYARYRYFSVGTDKLGGLFGFNDLYGLDFYFSVKFHILKGFCNRYKHEPDCDFLEF